MSTSLKIFRRIAVIGIGTSRLSAARFLKEAQEPRRADDRNAEESFQVGVFENACEAGGNNIAFNQLL